MKSKTIIYGVVAGLLLIGLVVSIMMVFRESAAPSLASPEPIPEADSSSPEASSDSATNTQLVSDEGDESLSASTETTESEPPAPFNMIRKFHDNGKPFRIYSETIETLLQTAGATDDPEARQELWQGLAEELMFEDPAAVSEVLTRIKSQSYQNEFAVEYALSLLENNPKEALQWAEDLDDALIRENVAYTLGVALARWDFDLAAQWLESGMDENLRACVVEGVAYEWAYDDPTAAYEWVESQTGDDAIVSDQAITNIAYGMSETDPQGAAVWVAELEEGPARTEALLNATARWLEEDPQAAASWVESLPKSKSRDKALMQIAYRWGAMEAEAALNWALGLEDDTLRHNAVTTIGQMASHVSPEKGLQVAEQLPVSKMRDEVLYRIQRQWVRKDPVAVANEILKLEDPSERARWLRHTTSSWTKRDPAGAAEFAESLADPVMRKENMLRVAVNWLQQDRAAAEQWIQSSSSPVLQNLKYEP